MPGTQLVDSTESYVFIKKGNALEAAATNYAFDDIVGTGKLIIPANEIVCDPPGALSRTPSQIQQTPVGRKEALSKAGASTFDQATLNVYLARNDADGFAISTEQQAAIKDIMDLADGAKFNLGILYQAPTDTPANNVVRGTDGNLTIPGTIDDASCRYIQATKNGGYDVISEGGFTQYVLQFTPSVITPMLDHG